MKMLFDPNFMGALVGAIITGLIAILVMYRTIANNRKQDKKKLLNDFLKESHFLLYSLDGLITHTTTFANIQILEEDSIKTDKGPLPSRDVFEIKEAKKLNGTDIEEYLRKIKSIDRNAFSRDVFNLYLDILNITEGTIEYFWRRSLEHSASGIGDILMDGIKKMNTLKETLEKEYEKKEEKYNRL